MNIIIIGPDGSGKTTLSKFLAREKQMKYIKCTYKENNKLNLAKKLIGESNNTIFDRFYYPDHLVYQQVKGAPLNKEEIIKWNDLETELVNNHFIMIYLDAPNDILAERVTKERVSDDGDKYINIDEFDKIKKYYEAFLTSTSMPLLKLYTNGFIKQRDLNKIDEFIDYTQKFFHKKGNNYLLNWEVFTGEAYTHCSCKRLI